MSSSGHQIRKRKKKGASARGSYPNEERSKDKKDREKEQGTWKTINKATCSKVPTYRQSVIQIQRF
jgi:hypothetical protein